MQGFLPANAVVETEHIPYLLTEKGSLVFTIAPNGHVWGHRVEDGGTKRDVELELYAPVEGGYTLRHKNEFAMPGFSQSDLTESQKKAIRLILAQKTSLQKVLETLVLRKHEVVANTSWNYRVDVTEKSALLSIANPNLPKVRVVDCSYSRDPLGGGLSNFNLLRVYYADSDFVFRVNSAHHGCDGGAGATDAFIKTSYMDQAVRTLGNASVQDLRDIYCAGYKVFEKSNSEFPHIVFAASRAEYGRFVTNHFPACAERGLIPSSIQVLCDTENIFDVFDIDDAMLVLEERRLSEEQSELHWTLAIAHNKILRNLVRIAKNSQELFKGLLK